MLGNDGDALHVIHDSHKAMYVHDHKNNWRSQVCFDSTAVNVHRALVMC